MAVPREGNAEYGAGVTLQAANFFPSFDIKQPYVIVLSTVQGSAPIGGESEAKHGDLAAFCTTKFPALVKIPKSQRAIAARRKSAPPVGQKHNVMDRAGVSP